MYRTTRQVWSNVISFDKAGRRLDLKPAIVEDSVSQSPGYGALRRRYIELSFLVDADNPQICLCATDTASTVAPGFAMLGNRTLESLVADSTSKQRARHLTLNIMNGL